MVDRLHVDGVPAVREALGLDAASADTAAAGTYQLLYLHGSLVHLSMRACDGAAALQSSPWCSATTPSSLA